MKKILLTVFVFLCFSPVMFAQTKEATKKAKLTVSLSNDAVRKAKDEKQIALKKAAAKPQSTQGEPEEFIKSKAATTKEN